MSNLNPPENMRRLLLIFTKIVMFAELSRYRKGQYDGNVHAQQQLDMRIAIHVAI
nr:hypothetical protein [uncultured Undibacterium sp.]